MKVAEIRSKSNDELDDTFMMLKKERFNLRFQRATGQLTNTSRLREARRDIARVKTVAAQRRALEKAAEPASKLPNLPINKDGAFGRFMGKLGGPAGRISEEREPGLNDYPSSSADPIQLLRDLRASDVKQRIDAMTKLKRTALTPAVAQYGASRLIPKLASENEEEAIAAAVTLCALAYPDRYKGKMDPRELHARVRVDLPKALHERRVDYFTIVEAERLGNGKVRVHARLTSELPFKLGGETATLQTPHWIQKSDDFIVTVSGPGVDVDSQHQSNAPKKRGDIGAVFVDCEIKDKPGQKLNVDFAVDHRHLKRERLSF